MSIITDLFNLASVNIGRQGETNATTLKFDLSEFETLYGSGTATIVHKRSGDTQPYIVSNVTQADSTLSWVVSDADTFYAGTGKAEIRWSKNGVLVKSSEFDTIVAESLMDESEEQPGAVVYMGDISGYRQETVDVRQQLENLLDALQPVTLSLDDDGNLVVTGNAIVSSVESVNGYTGNVVLTASIIGAYAKDTGEALEKTVSSISDKVASNYTKNQADISSVSTRCTALEAYASDLKTVKAVSFSADAWTAVDGSLNSALDTVVFSVGSINKLAYSAFDMSELSHFQLWQNGTKIVSDLTIVSDNTVQDGYTVTKYLAPGGYTIQVKCTSGAFSSSLTAGHVTVWFQLGGTAMRAAIL